jgi:hypothetical protein
MSVEFGAGDYQPEYYEHRLHTYLLRTHQEHMDAMADEEDIA